VETELDLTTTRVERVPREGSGKIKLVKSLSPESGPRGEGR
jgi:hypothetical protein